MKFFKYLNKFWVMILIALAAIYTSHCWNDGQVERNRLESGNLEKAVETNQF